ncbi:MAG: hypothetical protein JWP66_1544 [Naasia sp.]|nr:hypothetical protein [Naasia sp.]
MRAAGSVHRMFTQRLSLACATDTEHAASDRHTTVVPGVLEAVAKPLVTA